MSTANLVLSVVCQALMLVLLVILLRRALHKRFPVFVLYCTSIPAVALVRYLALGDAIRYFFVYWITEACYLIIAFFAILSVLRPLTRFEYVRHPWTRFLLFPFAMLIIGGASWAAIVGPVGRTPTPAGRFASAIYVFATVMSVAELLLFVSSFRARNRAIQWSRYEFAILNGFGALAALNLVAYVALVFRVLHFKVSPQLEQLFQAFPVGAFLASATVWLVAFWKEEPPRSEPDIGGFLDAMNVLLEQYKAQAEFVRRIRKQLRLRSVAFAR